MSKAVKSRKIWTVVGLVAVLLGWGLIAILRDGEVPNTVGGEGQPSSMVVENGQHDEDRETVLGASNDEQDGVADPEIAISAGLTPAEQFEAQQRLREDLLGLPSGEAIALILEYLDSGQDQSFRLPFKVGKGGLLKSAPSLRVWMLDTLEEVDLATATGYAETIFDFSDVADEWAIALRSTCLGREDTNGKLSDVDADYLEGRALELLGNSDWQQELSGGYLESFDIVPFLSREVLIDTMCGLFKSEGPIGHAAYISLNKTVTLNPESIEAVLPSMRRATIDARVRGQFVAQSNPSIPSQREFLDEWHLSAGNDELEGFFSVFPVLTQIANYSLYDTSFSRGQIASNYNSRLLSSSRLLNGWKAKASSDVNKEQIQAAFDRIQKAIK
ncbi:hypothetical protein IEN85_09860 [Pelagicoccus sp. NFK12]|uniref:Uncharacterized protein n=1 Tax=Pelagicoccus enzymogenes TaxID=2773457 RepID=A0A927F7P8_9BACT|nr:hypothetical protein [Pelagicoccus enzymogenes]MBD5779797.1 hypothetical protein [Pelagicoccus enzymogenes]